MENKPRVLPGGPVTSPESARASALFEQFVAAGTFKSVLATYRLLCEVLRLKPTSINSFFPRLKAKLHSWKAASLWAKLDKRASHKCYNRGKACPNTRVLIIGAGPCGLRAAIEAQLLGAKVVVVEKRDRFSRNNVLHLWPFVIHDLRNLGAKKFFGKFCAGSIDHISIRQLQLILLKVALLLGVEVHENVGFLSLKEPPEDQAQERIGWQAFVSPSDHPVSQYEFDVLIGADGKRNTLLGFNRKEFRGKLAIAVTANFINRHTLEEAGVEEISGVAFIFNQKFFQDMREETGINLENIVYYKDDTHYFVMTAKKQSLLERGVIINDYNDTARLLSAENVDRAALMEYARDAAAFATDYQLPSPDFAVNHYGQADVAMFDFTSMYAAENACRITERRGYKLLQGLVGDSLLEPFWPTGSGCARGFFSSFDAAWMIKSWASGRLTHLQVLAEREAIYRLLAQTTPENLSKDLNQYTLNPTSRYPNLNLQSVLPSQVRSLYDTDGKLEDIIDTPVEIPKKKRKRESIVHPDALLNWCQRQVALHDIRIENLTSSWKNGMALCSILHRYRPDLINVESLNPDDVAKNNQMAFDICEKELCIPPVMTGQEMAECEVPDKLSMVSYLAQIYDAFRGEIPVVCQPKSSNDERAISPNRQPIGTTRSILNRIGNKLQNKRKYSIEKESIKEKGESLKRGRHSQFLHKRRSKEKDKGIALDILGNNVTLMNLSSLTPNDGPKESINSRVKNLELQMMRDAGLRCHLREEISGLKSSPVSRSVHSELNIKQIQEQLQRNGSGQSEKVSGPKVGRLRKDEWNVKMLEEKISQQEAMLQKSSHVERSRIKQDIFDSKLRLIDAKLQAGGALTAEEKARFAKFDSSLSKLHEQLTKGNLDAGERGHNQVAAMTEHMTTIWDKKGPHHKKDPLPPAPVVNNTCQIDSESKVGGSEICYFCKKRVYLMERLSAEGLFFHRSCFKCEYCSASLRRGNYAFDKDSVCGGNFYCIPHFRMKKPDHRWQEMMKRKQAFLSHAFDEQEKEKMYTTLLANTEKALSPNKLNTENIEPSTVIDSTEIPEPLDDQKQAKQLNLLLEPLSVLGRDQTPERVEYENSILDYSEEELLTGELEEEELREKNFGPIVDTPTSDDAYSDFSDSESDEEAYAEELERSLTADETRKLAERWQRKYSAEHSLMDSDASSSSSSDEASDTEIGTEDGTSDDINSDEEYSVGHGNENLSDENVNESVQGSVSKTPDVKDDLTVEVPVIDLKGMNQNLEEETSSSETDISDASDVEKGLETESSSDEDSESEPEIELPPPQIPMIVIDESPPQDIDQDWPQVEESSVPSAQNGHVSSGIDVEVTDTKTNIEPPGNKILDKDIPLEMPKSTCDITEEPAPIVSSFETVENKMGSSVELVSDVDVLATRTPIKLSDICLISKSLAIEQVSGVNTFGDSNSCNLLTECGENFPQSSETQDSLTGNGTVLSDVVMGRTNESFLLAHEDESATSKKDSDPVIPTTNDSVMSVATDEIVQKDSGSVILSGHSRFSIPILEHLECSESSLASQESSACGDKEPRKSEEYNLDLRFVTIRNKKDDTKNDTFAWDSDNSISMPWYCDKSDEIDLRLSSPAKVNLDGNSNLNSAFESEIMKTPVDTKPKSESTDTFVTPVYHQEKSSEFFTPFAPNVNSTPFDKRQSHLTNDLLSPISETDSKSITDPVKPDSKKGFKTETAISKNDNFKDKVSNYSDINSNHTPQNNNSSAASTASENGSNKSKSKYSGYSGSFAEKIRPKSVLGDSIYLRSLNINLQKHEFPSLTKSIDKLDDTSLQNCDVRKKLFHGSDKSLSQSKQSPNEITDSFAKGFKRQTSVPLDNKDVQPQLNLLVSQALTKTPITQSKKDIDESNSFVNKTKNVSIPLVLQDSYADPVSPYTYAQSRPPTENAFPIKMRPTCDMDLNKLKEKREKRKSVHENIQGLPFADEEKVTTPVDPPTSIFVTPHPDDIFPNDDDDDNDDDLLQRTNQSVAQEQARKEARARARLKSDEELGLSPKNYRKKYQRQLSFSSIYYDELNSDEFYDHENEELGDDIPDGNSLQMKKILVAEAQSESSDIDEPNSDNASIKSSADSVISNHSIKTLEKSSSKQDFCIADSNVINQSEPNLPISPPVKTSSSEPSPEVFEPEVVHNKVKVKTKKPVESVEGIADEEKSKGSSKKSFFSILNFGKSHISKDKSNKGKVKEAERASSLPADLGVSKTATKPGPLSTLKLSKGKDKYKEKRRQKHFSTGTQEIMVIENTHVEASVPSVAEEHAVEEPKCLLLSSSQAIPKYEVYRNPGTRLTAIPNHMPSHKTENGLAPKALEDSFSDTEDDTQRSHVRQKSVDADGKDKDASEKEKKVQKVMLKVQKQQELKRLRNAQEIQRRLEEVEVQQKDLERQGVELEKVLRGEEKGLKSSKKSDLEHEWCKLIHSKNLLIREEQELLIRLKELELEDRQSRLQQEMMERMAESSISKNQNQIGEEKKILMEMLRIVDERDELVAMLEQLRMKEEENEKSLKPSSLTAPSCSKTGESTC